MFLCNNFNEIVFIPITFGAFVTQAGVTYLPYLPYLLRLLLMLAPSLSLAPVAPVDLARSEPARSTRLILAKVLLLSSVASFWCTYRWSMAPPERVEVSPHISYMYHFTVTDITVTI